ncbi:MAG: hypothetical protein DBY32_11420 [Phascolarctobacterium sp.]|nr:MAG: hypothetical protein DBY32_11420 [Phascolarctobacterium sp.]
MTTLRRNKGEGSIIKMTNGKYRVRLECEPVNGKRKWLSKTAPTLTEARKALQGLIKTRDDTKSAKSYAGDFEKLMEEYLEQCELNDIKESTYLRYDRALKNWCKYFKHYKVRNVSVRSINEVIKQRTEEGYKPATIRMELVILAQAFKYALKCRYIDFNPVSQCAMPTMSKIRRTRGELVTITHKEHERISNYFKELTNKGLYTKHDDMIKYRMYHIYTLAYTTGMRLGEIAGLQWNDIDFDKHIIHVNRTVSLNKTLTTPKTLKSRRDIEVSSTVLEVLKELRGTMQELGCETDFVFPMRFNKNSPCIPSTISHQFITAIKKLNINRHLTFHSIRHTHATELIENQIPITAISERLGHSTITTTLNIYSHVTSTGRHNAAQVCKVI